MNTAAVFTTVFMEGHRHLPTLKTMSENMVNYKANRTASKNTLAQGSCV